MRDAKSRFAEAFNELCLKYGKDPSWMVGTGRAWWGDLESFGIDAVVWALEEAARTKPQFPSLADILSLIQGEVDPRAVECFGQCVAASLRAGPHKSVCFDPITNAVVRALSGSWSEFAKELRAANGIAHLRKTFVSQWNAYATKGYSMDDGYLPGLAREPKPSFYLPPGMEPPALPEPEPQKALPSPDQRPEGQLDTYKKWAGAIRAHVTSAPDAIGDLIPSALCNWVESEEE